MKLLCAVVCSLVCSVVCGFCLKYRFRYFFFSLFFCSQLSIDHFPPYCLSLYFFFIWFLFVYAIQRPCELLTTNLFRNGGVFDFRLIKILFDYRTYHLWSEERPLVRENCLLCYVITNMENRSSVYKKLKLYMRFLFL